MTEALLLDRDLSLRLGHRYLPQPRPGELAAAVEWAGVCGRDLHALRSGESVAYWPATLGHEVVGTVETCPGGELPAGRRVVIDPLVPCGACAGCVMGPDRCGRPAWVGEAHPGGFAGHVLVAADRVVPCPDGLEPALAVLAEPLAVAMHAAAQAGGPPGRAAVLGYGPFGALVHLEITRRWPDTEVTVVEPAPSRRELAEALGAGVTSREELAASNGSRPGLVVDAAGYGGALSDARCLCADGGTVIALGRGSEPVQIPATALAGRGLTIAFPAGFSGELAAATAELASDPERYRPLVTESVLLDEAPERLRELAESASAGKVLIRP
jgi:threonine dehydrogenase-like Zn-dependent dehydrogenase